MNDHALTHSLNDAQQAAVTAPAAATLVLAGAGSGKTRVLVHRIAWLISHEGVSPHSILAVTFTNKAAGEMRGRIESLMGLPAHTLWMGTFHGLAHRLLRQHFKEAGLPQTFQILDSDDQLRLVKKVVRGMELDEARWVPREITYFINAQKDEGRRSKHLSEQGDPTRQMMIKIYREYETLCQRNGVVDFAELLLRTFELLRDNEALLAHYQQRFQHVLVDEFQDTNTLQYQWIKLIVGQHGIPFVVGDDDQSIYGWRGAKIENIRRFSQDFKNCRVHRLEQNYRSTGVILEAANGLIAHNRDRMGKNLWTQGARGELIKIYAAFNEHDESDFIVNRVREWVAKGGARQDVAILYRSNAQSRVLEEGFIQARIPYKVYGGLRFFERAEIKDALAYLRLINQRQDDASLERIINLPTRGIGAKSLDSIRDRARAQGISMWDAAKACVAAQELGPKGSLAVAAFLSLIERLSEECRHLDLHETVDKVITHSGLIGHFQKEKGEKGEQRVENLEELVSAARGFQWNENEPMSAIDAFLAHAALEAGEGQAAEWEDSVQMMTLHSAKGLEFKLVFMAGLEEGLFPHQRSVVDIGGLEEERRLAYVGMTRAMQLLYLCYAESRRLHGVDQVGSPSRFISEVPAELIEEVRPRIAVSRPYGAAEGSRQQKRDLSREFGRFNSTPAQGRGFAQFDQSESHGGFKLGSRVRHGKFGDGVIIRLDGNGAATQVEVNFERHGRKVLMLSYANLSPL